MSSDDYDGALRDSLAYFEEETYRTETGIGETVWHYENIALPVKTWDYYVFVFSANHAQIYDRSSLSGGTEEAFEKRIEAATGKTFQVI